VWFTPWVRDMAFASVALARMGHREEAREALLAYFNARPTGKISIEVPMNALAGIRGAVRCEVQRMVFLDRGNSGGLERIGAESALEQMMQNSYSYSLETQARHEKALRRLLRMPSYRLRYERLQDAVEALESLTA